MPDVLHFDTDHALKQFLKVFWKKGYRATTTKELARVAGISEGSLFHSFSSKRAIYINALQRYRDNSRFMVEKMEHAESALEGIRSYWEAMGEFAADARRPQGCMITNATVELSEDPEFVDFIKSVHSDYDKQFKKTLDRAVGQGELRADTDTEALAQYLSHCAQGLRVISRLTPERSKIQNIVNMTLSTLEQFKPQA